MCGMRQLRGPTSSSSRYVSWSGLCLCGAPGRRDQSLSLAFLPSQELFEAPYFCQEQLAKYYDLAKPLEGNPLIERFASLAKELGVVLPRTYSMVEVAALSWGTSFLGMRKTLVLTIDRSLHECTLACSFIELTWDFRAQCTPCDAHTLVNCVPLTPGPLAIAHPAVSFFERAGNAYFNSLVVADADGSIVGHYRKSHIPDGPGYQEKFYFSPGDTGFKVFDTRFGRIGALICWDQWFPEGARCLALMGAELIFYPTAIGSEPPPAPPVSSYLHWQRVMAGHAGASMVPVIAANRIGKEEFEKSHITFYGGSFITDETGRVVAQVSGRLLGRGLRAQSA